VLHRNARYSVIQAALGAVALNLSNQFVGIYAVKLGANNLQLGYLSSWPQMVSVVSVLVIAGAVARSASKQRLIAAIYLLGRLATILLAMVNWPPTQLRGWALIILLGAGDLPDFGRGQRALLVPGGRFPGLGTGPLLCLPELLGHGCRHGDHPDFRLAP